MTIREAFERSIDACGIDRVKAGAMIAAAGKLADMMDTPGWPMVDGRYDNVSPSTFLKYCESLGLNKNVGGEKKSGNLADMRLIVSAKKKVANA